MGNKKVLFVDDQYCKEGNQSTLLAEFGPLTRQGYDFLYETAWNGQEYSAQKVVDRINEISPVYAVVSDMKFTDGLDIMLEDYVRGERFGLTLLRKLKQEFPKLPVIMHSSISDKGLVSECMESGASDYLEKIAMCDELKESLEKLRGRK